MGLLRTILSFVMLIVLLHIGLVYIGMEQSANALTQVIYSLGTLLEAPATFVLDALGTRLPGFMDPNGFFTIALSALAIYFVLYVLLGFGRD